jgi:DNA-binding CsgD family transcriptional regulator/PAS domain-containing protein
MYSAELISSLIDDIYESALDANQWVGFLNRLNGLLDAAYVGILVTNAQQNMPRMAYNSDWDQHWLDRLFNEFMPKGLPGVENFTYDDLDSPRSTLSRVSEAEFQKSDFYQQWAGPQGLRDGGVVKFLQSEQRFGFLSIVTSHNREIIGAKEFRLLSLLSPHIRRAALIGDLLDHQRIENILLKASLDALSAPIILVGRDGNVRHCNEPARKYLSQSKGLHLDGDKLVVNNPIARRAFEISMGVRNQTQLGNHGLGIPISSPSEPTAVAYLLPLTPAGRSQSELRDGPSMAIFIATSKANQPLPLDVLCTLYNLTQAEARVMIKVAEGSATKEVSTSLGTSINTVNTHLSKVFEKTGLNRRSDLVKLVHDIKSPLRNLFDQVTP